MSSNELSLEERETHINFNEKESTAHIFVSNFRLNKKLDLLCEKYPDQCKLIEQDKNWNHKIFEIPKKWIRINAPRKISEETRQKFIERMHGIKSEETTPYSSNKSDQQNTSTHTNISKGKNKIKK